MKSGWRKIHPNPEMRIETINSAIKAVRKMELPPEAEAERIEELKRERRQLKRQIRNQ